jgi:ATP-binding protein involved in chromosome partitioning
VSETAAPAVTETQIRDALATVQYPGTGRDLNALGFVGRVKICEGLVGIDVELPGAAGPSKETLRSEIARAVGAVPGVTSVTVNLTSAVRRTAPKSAVLGEVKNVIAVASGKGGVGKSTVAANLACALKKAGGTVGLMDCDIYGPSQPMMFGVAARPQMTARGDQILPIEQYGIGLMSMGFLSDERTPVIWRGPMVHNLLRQFLGQVAWGPLDYLVMDLPPGTGDAQLTLTQLAPLSGAVIVTTPQDVSLIDARKGLRMFQEVKVPVLGVVENMSVFACEACGHRHEIFRRGGARKLCEENGVPYLGEVPIDPEVVLGGDEGTPIVIRKPDSPAAKAFTELADRVAAGLAALSLRDEAEIPSLKL